ncbi:SDR family NAD(P)-dependent oxidoreductase [Shewanella aestuarii]|uniref:SDR family NAD(P)-dependent oxidoreductase n=1 Tax=Shewanella aestuarii TaxID=1028752 RepID=A0A6G9QGT3_9GAMM|nr:SDR family NAD(P)-dependent oxidoreductase [Shewanella aestuarii]QIR13686.1 SDR family NAD(P)-dependent oxidoreductase [Shewanella aestuarii]
MAQLTLQATQQATPTILIIGASSTLANAFALECIQQAYETLSPLHIVTVSRANSASSQLTDLLTQTDLVSHQHFTCDYQPSSITHVVNTITQAKDGATHIAKVFICNGILHDIAPELDAQVASNQQQSLNQTPSIKPEKRLEEINSANLMQVFHTNSVIPTLWLQALIQPLSRQKQRCDIVLLSARVGSISDNHLGGWYSYRASKAALNMLIKTAAVEYARRAKQVKLVAFHPGTTDSPLSKPFQANVPAGKLFSAEFVAERLAGILTTLPIDGEASFIDWQGNSISW